ncbi:arsenate reductase ArsC [Methylobacter sp.]|uniref:arsenate reductase ArsC n=1 Tax=Methylobacter sp. TaxID=2051955 RepID=UPI003DA3451B
MGDKIYNVLILSVSNSGRSIMAEALFNKLGKGRFNAYSAGSQPTGQVNPFAIEQIRKMNYPTDELRSKSWNEFSAPDAPKMDFVIAICDDMANEVWPAWPGDSITMCWVFEDPAAVQGSDEEKRLAFEKVFLYLMNRVRILSEMSRANFNKLAFKREMEDILRGRDNIFHKIKSVASRSESMQSDQ